MKILDKPKPESTDASSVGNEHLAEDVASLDAPFKPLGKDPKRAFALSVLPGLGHLYIGQVVSGLVFLTSTALSLLLVASTCFGTAILALMQKLATDMHVGYNADFAYYFGAMSLSHPAVLTFVFLYLCFVLYVGQDAYLYATRANNPIYPPQRGIRFAPVFGGSYFVHCAALVILLAGAFLVTSKKPADQVTVIDVMLEPPPPPKEKPLPEPPKPKLQPKSTPKPEPEKPRPVQKVERPVEKAVEAPPVVKEIPNPIASVPVAPSQPASEPSTGTGTGDPSGQGTDTGSSGGGDGDEADFSGYLSEMEKKIRKAWFPPRGNESAKIIVAFKLNSAGKVSSVRLKTSSGLMLADTAATDAIKNGSPFGNLPKGAPDKVDIVFTFDYTVFNGGGKAALR